MTGTPMQTLLLASNGDTSAPIWDLCLDAAGNIAVASPPYAVAQDAASAIATFQGEVWYDTTLGVPYFAQVLSEPVPISLVKKYFTDAAMTVPGTLSATVYLNAIVGRKLTGQVQIKDTSGASSYVGF